MKVGHYAPVDGDANVGAAEPDDEFVSAFEAVCRLAAGGVVVV